MKKITLLLSLACVAGLGVCLAAVEKTMSVPRCQAMLKDGTQCSAQVDPGATYCWRHRGAAKAVKETMDDAGKGASKAWTSTKNWTTNAWENTKSGTSKAWTATREAFEEAGEEFTKMMRKNFQKDKDYQKNKANEEAKAKEKSE